MALAEKRISTFDATTLALWRVAESGDVEELAALLPRIKDINARNEHGVTALMRAAQDGHVKMVRALLEHGADANIRRNDKFTALALAAFFGHTAVVRVLMEHGADSHASTRNGTSPQMWATARTFNEVVDQLEQPVQRPKTAIRSVPAAACPAPAVVRTLKDPPEIWDLVHEAPRGFDPRSAFLARLESMKAGFAFRAAAAVVLIGLCVVGVWVLRGVQARSERSVEPAPPVVTAQPKNISQPVAPAVAPVAESQPATEPEIVAPAGNEDNKPVAISRSGSRSRVANSHSFEPRPRGVETEQVVQPVAAPSEKSEPPVRVETATKPKPKPSDPLSPQLITPAKSSAPKAKVIQWP